MKKINVVVAVIRDNDKILATKRLKGKFKDYWEFPGGKIEENETLHQALLREIKEEIDVEIDVLDLLDIVEYDYADFKLYMHCFWAKIKSGNIVLKEVADAKWLTRENIDSVKWLPADIELVKKIKEKI